MRFVDIINKKRLNQPLTKEEIQFWIDGYVKGDIPDYQVSALCMAIVLNGMNREETRDLTMAMTYSGDVIDLSAINGVKVDKHSTGGVGDKTSLSLTPMVAACGAKVAKMSGRGLGHTGGTLDKLESIKGFDIMIGQEDFIRQVNEIGVSIVGQNAQLVPADKKLYALRDVTGTVQSIPLIASSIMSKKLASGADTILLDVKYGEGAFMQTVEEAKVLAKTMIEIGTDCGRDTRAMITDMNQPLGKAIGNALEVKEAIETLKGNGPEDFTELCMTAGSIMLQQAHIAKDETEARAMLKEAVTSGAALQKLRDFVKAQHGDVKMIDNPELLPSARFMTPVKTRSAGFVTDLKALELGNLAMRLGAGRATKEDVINPAVGIVLNKKVGNTVRMGEALAIIHHDTPLEENWLEDFYNTFTIEPTCDNVEPLIAAVL
ncbi:MAG: pyrimidine-nucleoside phosphorylase [Erysipelotrichaceae bacterium]|nr:pyrimidine-nucleoside phosphorylase [Erysipelotrichaceae bacterium]